MIFSESEIRGITPPFRSVDPGCTGVDPLCYRSVCGQLLLQGLKCRGFAVRYFSSPSDGPGRPKAERECYCVYRCHPGQEGFLGALIHERRMQHPFHAVWSSKLGFRTRIPLPIHALVDGTRSLRSCKQGIFWVCGVREGSQ